MLTCAYWGKVNYVHKKKIRSQNWSQRYTNLEGFYGRSCMAYDLSGSYEIELIFCPVYHLFSSFRAMMLWSKVSNALETSVDVPSALLLFETVELIGSKTFAEEISEISFYYYAWIGLSRCDQSSCCLLKAQLIKLHVASVLFSTAERQSSALATHLSKTLRLIFMPRSDKKKRPFILVHLLSIFSISVFSCETKRRKIDSSLKTMKMIMMPRRFLFKSDWICMI